MVFSCSFWVQGNPSPYMYYLAMGDAHIIGASPEMLVRVEDGLVENHPIAGTRRRGRDAEDERPRTSCGSGSDSRG